MLLWRKDCDFEAKTIEILVLRQQAVRSSRLAPHAVLGLGFAAAVLIRPDVGDQKQPQGRQWRSSRSRWATTL
nr:hypothetical protein Itr_chr01CG01150 [Ipomoea trifida]GLL24294.1 hypothetical protein Itr_chr04CG07580 [Ipomoea trifida]